MFGKYFYISIFFFFSSFQLYAQNIDSLIRNIDSYKDDSSKVVYLLNNVYEYYRKQGKQKEGLNYAHQANELAMRVNYAKGEVQSLICLGDAYNVIGEYDKGLNNLKKALEISQNGSFKKSQIAAIYFNLGTTLELKGELLSSLEYLFKAIETLESTKPIQYDGVGSILTNISIVYKKNKQYHKAIEYCYKSLEAYQKTGNESKYATVYSNIASNLIELHDYKKALTHYKKALNYALSSKNNKNVCTSTSGIGLVYQNWGKYDEALKFHFKAYQIAQKNGYKRYEAIALINIGVDYKLKKDFEKANNYLNKSLEIAKELGAMDLSKDVYDNLSQCYEDQNSYAKSLEALKLKTEFDDSIYKTYNIKQINELSVKYETEKKKKRIEKLNAKIKEKQKDKIILESKIEKRNAIIGGTIIGTILLVVSLVLFFNRRRLVLANAHQKEINEQRELTTTEIVQALEKEQSRIAKDLHDSIGTFLSTLKINLQLYEDEVPKDKQENYQKTLNLIDKISFELRNIMKNLSHDTLQDHGLDKALEEFIGRLNELKITELKYYISDLSPAVTEHIQHNLYRISQELLTNCIKHAKAEAASIQIIEDDNIITLMYEDNGIGIIPSVIENRNSNQSMGMKNIFNRVEFIRGNIQIDTNPKSGTTIIIQIPVSQK